MKERLFLAAAILFASYAANFRPPTKIEGMAGELINSAIAGNIRKTTSLVGWDPEDPSFSAIQANTLINSLRGCEVKSMTQQGEWLVSIPFKEACGRTKDTQVGPGGSVTRIEAGFGRNSLGEYQAESVRYFAGNRSRETLLLSPYFIDF